jgi:uncharacterized iron-regulated protein
LGSPQLGQSPWAAAVKAWCERRMLRRDGEVFRFGTAMAENS